jgi:hypothetical protein
MLRTAALLLVLCLAAVAVAGEDKALLAAKRRIQAIRNADVVILARVERVHRGPEVWCGFLVTRQEVSWKVEEVISSSLPEKTIYDGTRAMRPVRCPGPKVGEVIRVGHLLVGGGLVYRDYPSLRPDLVHAGARAILLLNQQPDHAAPAYFIQDETFGVRLLDPPLVPDQDRRAILAALLDSKALAPYLHPETEGRKPIRIALSGSISTPVLTLSKFDLPVLFLAKEELTKDPYLEVTALTIEGDAATIVFRYDVEGLTGKASLTRDEGGFKVVAATVTEH